MTSNGKLTSLNKEILQAVALVIDPLDSWELAGLILGALFLVINVAMTIAGAAWYVKVLFTITHHFLVWLVLAYARDGKIDWKDAFALGAILFGIVCAILSASTCPWLQFPWAKIGIASGLVAWFISLIWSYID